MIILDTCVLIYDALCPEKMTPAAKKAMASAEKSGSLYCSDISLWEIAMLIQKKRLDPGTDAESFLKLLFQAKPIQVLPIEIPVAILATSPLIHHYDPADRLIAATAMHYQATLITSDKKLRDVADLVTIW